MMKFDGKWHEEQLEARVEELEAALKNTVAAYEMFAEAESCWMCNEGFESVHQPYCTYDQVEAALNATPAEAEEGES